jgi:rhodanese-related sulfurtransferase
MKNKIFKKMIIFSIMFIILLSAYSNVNALKNRYSNFYLNNSYPTVNYIDITAEEAWNLLNDTSNGLQIPIDVRTDNEWKSEHINTPKPENPRHHNFFEWDDQEILTDFMTLYNGNEIIVYCRTGSRSVSAINILIDNGFNGIIYNMLGGITDWKSSGFPIIGNQPPDKPDISGKVNGKVGETYEYGFIANDPENDTIYYYINWSDNSTEDWIGPYNSGTEVIITHNWTEQGIYLIQAKVRDKYGDESNWSTLEINMPEEQKFARISNLFIWIMEKIFIFKELS